MMPSPAYALKSIIAGNYTARYQGNAGGGGCSNKMDPGVQGTLLTSQSITLNLNQFRSDIVSRIQDWGNRTTEAIIRASKIEEMLLRRYGMEDTQVKQAMANVEQNQRVELNTLEAMKAMSPTPFDTDISQGMAFYNPDLAVSFRQSEMKRYINEMNLVPLRNEDRDASGYPKDGYVDTSLGEISAISQEFRNFIKIFCDVRSGNGRLASTKFEEKRPSGEKREYWCGQWRGLTGPNVARDEQGYYKSLQGAPLDAHIKAQLKREEDLEANGEGFSNLINGPKNIGDLYFEPHSLEVGNDALYNFAEQEFARMVIGRAPAVVNMPRSFDDATGQRDFMFQQARIAKLALSRYAFADLFSKKVPTLSANSAAWAAQLIEENLGNCEKPDPSYEALCMLTKQLKKKNKISESEFFDVLFNRQFQGEAFTNKVLAMSPGQLKRTQATLMGLQLALNYQRNRLKEQQVALMAALYAQQSSR